MNNVKEIIGKDLKGYASNFRDCKFGEVGCVLKPKFGNIKFQLNFLAQYDVCKIYIRRLSGDGRVLIKNGDSVHNWYVLSKISQVFDINIKDTIIEVSRPPEGTGEIEIIKIDVISNHIPEENTLAQNWKSLIAKCGKYNSLRLVDGRLFASDGAYIENGNFVSEIETNPAGMWLKDGERLKFAGACEIVKLVVNNNYVSTTPNLFVHRDGPTPHVVTGIPVTSDTINTVNKNEPLLNQNNFQIDTNTIKKDNIIYDSSRQRGFDVLKARNNKLVKSIYSNGQSYALIKRGGSSSIPIADLAPNKEYSVIINAKKYNGNGRIYFGFGEENAIAQTPKNIITDNNFSDKYLILKTPENLNPNESFRLYLSMPDDCLGEVLISRIMIVESLPINFGNIANYSNYKSYANSNLLKFGKKRFVIVVPSYNNRKWCELNIKSTLSQNYDSYRVIFTDDCSTDGTFEKVTEIVNASDKKDKVTLIQNSTRQGALANLYNMIYSCDDDEIILTLDGDDWLANENVLNKLNDVYSNNDVWMTYGQYQNYPDPGVGIAQRIPDHVIRDNTFRQYTWCSSHLRTFYTWLFKQIKKEDMIYEGKFYTMTWDMVMMFPMLEMCGHRSAYINDILYIYNLENPINDHKVNVKMQQDLDRHVRRMPKYQKLDAPIMKDIQVGLLIIATNQYDRFIQGLISSADNYFLNEPNIKVTYYVFSDKTNNIVSKREAVQLRIEHRPFPHASMDRFRHFINHEGLLSRENYLYYVDVDSLFVDYISKDILGNLAGVRHCGYVNTIGPFENNTNSVFYVHPNKYRYYFGGGFSGGRSKDYLELSYWCANMIDKDLVNNIVPLWHDETALNRYFLDHPPDVVLSPSYHHPQSQIDRYKKLWYPEVFPPKIMLLDKKHNQIR